VVHVAEGVVFFTGTPQQSLHRCRSIFRLVSHRIAPTGKIPAVRSTRSTDDWGWHNADSLRPAPSYLIFRIELDLRRFQIIQQSLLHRLEDLKHASRGNRIQPPGIEAGYDLPLLRDHFKSKGGVPLGLK
jgi:hypothetical protein